MKHSTRVIVDTNVIVSAALWPNSVPGKALDLAEAGAVLLASAPTFDELKNVLTRPKFAKFLTIGARSNYLRRYRAIAEVVQCSSTIDASRDPRDNKFLELAVDGHADVIVSGDVDLLSLDPFQGIRILSPQAFLVNFGVPPEDRDRT